MNIQSLPLFILISSGLLNAQVIPGRWEKRDSLRAGEQIFITFKSGGVINYNFKSADSTKLRVIRSGSIETNIPKADVAKVVRLKPRSNKAAWIGAGVGAAAVAVTVPVYFCSANGCRGKEILSRLQ